MLQREKKNRRIFKGQFLLLKVNLNKKIALRILKVPKLVSFIPFKTYTIFPRLTNINSYTLLHYYSNTIFKHLINSRIILSTLFVYKTFFQFGVTKKLSLQLISVSHHITRNTYENHFRIRHQFYFLQNYNIA